MFWGKRRRFPIEPTVPKQDGPEGERKKTKKHKKHFATSKDLYEDRATLKNKLGSSRNQNKGQ